MRRGGMIRTALATAAASALVFHLGGCQKGPAAPAPESSNAPIAAGKAGVSGMTSLGDSAASSPSSSSGHGATSALNDPGFQQLLHSRDPVRVVDALAATIEAREWQRLRAFWGDGGARSGLDRAAFAEKWSRLTAPVVTVGEGRMEGAAGSLYYTVPVTIVDAGRTMSGEIVMRRANDVPGATKEQLRWHIESTTLEP